MKRKLYSLFWNVLKSADLISTLPENAPIPTAMLSLIYKGNGLRLLGQSHSKPRLFTATLTTKAKDNEGNIHTLEMKYRNDEPMYLSQLINAVKMAWLNENDVVLADMDVIDVQAVARCWVI